jgi:hypothetical protein
MSENMKPPGKKYAGLFTRHIQLWITMIFMVWPMDYSAKLPMRRNLL